MFFSIYVVKYISEMFPDGIIPKWRKETVDKHTQGGNDSSEGLRSIIPVKLEISHRKISEWVSWYRAGNEECPVPVNVRRTQNTPVFLAFGCQRETNANKKLFETLIGGPYDGTTVQNLERARTQLVRHIFITNHRVFYRLHFEFNCVCRLIWRKARKCR